MGRKSLARLMAITFFGLGVALIFSRLVWEDDVGLWVGQEHCWSDYPFQIAMMQRVAHLPMSEWMSSHPMVADMPLRYPPMMNVISGLMLRVGFSVRDALIWPHVILFIGLAWVMFEFFLKCGCKAGSALLGMAIFYLASGWGFISWLTEIWNGGGWKEMFFPSAPYTRVDEFQWYNGNFLAGMLIPQRTFLPGLVIGLTTLLLAMRLFFSDKDSEKHRFLLQVLVTSGVIMLTFTHVHSMIAVLTAMSCMLAASIRRHPQKRVKNFLTFIISVICCGITYLIVYGVGNSEVVMTSVQPWWPKEGGFLGWVNMWWKLWGIFLLVATTGFVLFFIKKKMPFSMNLIIFLAGFFLFLVGNIILLQPIRWDNSKIFLWAYLFMIPIVAKTIIYLAKKGVWGFIPAFVLMCVLVLSGISECIRLVRVDKHRFLIGQKSEMEMGQWVLSNTAMDSVFLTHKGINPWPMTWGARSVYLGFTGWMPNFQADHRARESELVRAFNGDTSGVIARHPERDVYLIYGPYEKYEFPHSNTRITEIMNKVYENGDTEVWKIRGSR